MKWEPRECAPGDMIRVKLGSVYHFGIFVSEDEVIQFGHPPIARYKDEQPVCVLSDTIDNFACGHFVETAVLDRKEKRKRRSPGETVRIARSRLGEQGYNIIHNNCEHFANECVFGEKRSEQTEAIRKMMKSLFNKEQD